MTLNNPYEGKDQNGNLKTFTDFTVAFSTSPLRVRMPDSMPTTVNIKFFGTVVENGDTFISEKPFAKLSLADVAKDGDSDALTAFGTIQYAIQNYANAKDY